MELENEERPETAPEQMNARLVKRWLTRVEAAKKKQKTWQAEGTKLVKKYRVETEEGKTKSDSFSVYTSNTAILKAALFPKSPVPVVHARDMMDNDPVARMAAEILENNLSFSLDDYPFDDVVEDSLLDALTAGRGMARVVYKPTFTPVPEVNQVTEPTEQSYVGEDGLLYEETYTNQVTYEEARCEYWAWDDVFFIGGNRWNDITAIAFYSEYTQEEMEAQFGEELAKKVKYTLIETKENKAKEQDGIQKTAIYEIWDKVKKERLYISEGYPNAPLSVEGDPLGLKDFFPCPRPMTFITTNGTFVPVPLYNTYRALDEELQNVCIRLKRLVKKLQVKGVYSAEFQEIARLYGAEDTTLIPVANFPKDIDISKAIAYMPLEEIARVVVALSQRKEELKQDIYEVTGISDIVRGASSPSETATAQRIKGQFASIRLDDLKKEAARFQRDLLEIKGEIMARLFDPNLLFEIAGVKLPTQQEAQVQQMQQAQTAIAQGMPPPPPEPVVTQEAVVTLLKADNPRRYRVDIEIQETMEPDVDAKRQRSIELLTAIGQLAQQAPVIDAAFGAGFSRDMMAITASQFYAGKQIDQVIEKAKTFVPAPSMPAMPMPQQGVM